MQFWVQCVQPTWLPEGFQVPEEMANCVHQLCQEAENAYYQTDKDRNGFLRRREFKKAMKLLGINKFEARHMLIFVDKERLKVVSIKDYVNAYLFIKSGGLNHITTDYQGPITTGIDNRVHLHNAESKLTPVYELFFTRQPQQQVQLSTSSVPSSFITCTTVFNSIPRSPPIKTPISFNMTLKASNGMYLCSENGKVVANRPVASVWETFSLINDTDWGNMDLCAFKTWWSKYICCESNNDCVDNRTAIGPWEKFTSYSQGGSGAFAFKSWTGGYLTADAAGNVSFGATTVGPNEVWIIKAINN